MDTYVHENREYFQKRIHQLNTTETSGKDSGNIDRDTEVPDTSVCVRIRPLSELEIENGHIEGVLPHDYGIAKIYEPRKKVRGKPDLNVQRPVSFQKANNADRYSRAHLLLWMRFMAPKRVPRIFTRVE